MLTRLLIANRGEIACRIIRTARAMGIQTVAVYGSPDRQAMHVAAADLAVPLDGVSAAETYLAVNKLLRAAADAGADAIHPGYGFLAERADFAQAVIDAGLTWVGPPPPAIAAMGDKLHAKQLMTAAGVPILPSVDDPDQADTIGYPLLIKPVAGGGGKGMRVVTHEGDLADAVAGARRTAAAAFGDDRVFLERYLPNPRHIEVQVLADHHGTVVHLGERECSLQRRHQKVIEEAPSPAVDAATRAKITRAATAAVRAIEYHNAGTVEFIATRDPAGDLAFYFLEVNTRLQVEHPVTEQAWRLAGDPDPVDLVRLQLLVAEGHPLPFGQDDLELRHHAVEARLYAEDVPAGFLPATGTVMLLQPAGLPQVRWDVGVRTGDQISPYFDPMIAKVIATAGTRSGAVRLLAAELRQTRFHGVTTNREALVSLLTHPRFVDGDFDTTLVEGLSAEELAAPPDTHTVAVHVIAATLAGMRQRRDQVGVQRTIPAGWRNNRSAPTQIEFTLGVDTIAVTYAPEGADIWRFTVDDVAMTVTLHGIAGDVVDMGIDDRLRVQVVATPLGAAGVLGVDSALGHTLLVEVPRFPPAADARPQGSLVAPMPGAVVSVQVSEGTAVARGDQLMVLEAMKMEHPITAPTGGTVAQLLVAVDDQVQTGDVLAVIQSDEPNG